MGFHSCCARRPESSCWPSPSPTAPASLSSSRRPDMRQSLLLAAGLLTIACVGSEPASPPPATPSAMLFEGATLIDGETGAARRDAAFLVEGQRIVRVGGTGEIDLPAGGRRVDLTGKTVIPALVSAHIHVGLLDGSDFGPQVYTRDKTRRTPAALRVLRRRGGVHRRHRCRSAVVCGPRRAAAAGRAAAHGRPRHGGTRRRPGLRVDRQHVVPDHHPRGRPAARP